MALAMVERLASKLPQTLRLPTEVPGVSKYVGVESHDMKAVLAQLSETPCVTVQVKVTTSPGHAAVLPSCSTLDTNVTSATGINIMDISNHLKKLLVRHFTSNMEYPIPSKPHHLPAIATG